MDNKDLGIYGNSGVNVLEFLHAHKNCIYRLACVCGAVQS